MTIPLSVFCILTASIIGFSSCGEPTPKTAPQTEEVVLATIDGTPITLVEFKTFSKPIPQGMKKGKTPLDKNRQVLKSLIDKRLMLAEAATIPLEQDPKLQAELAFFTTNRLLDLYTKREVSNKITVSDEEMEEHYRATHRDRALRFSGIMLETLAEAEEILQQIDAGANFMELAKGHSLHRDSGEQGGDVGGYKLKDKVHPAIAQAIFPLPVGQVSKPIQMPFGGKPHYAVFQVTDEMPLPIEASQRKIREEIFGRKRAARYQALLDSLKETYHPELRPEQIRWLTQYSQQATDDLYDLPADQADKPICSYRDGQISLNEFMQIAREMHAGRPELSDSSRVVFLLDSVLVPAFIFAAEARAQGLDEHPALRERITDKRDNLLLSALRQRFVDQHIGATAAETRAFYDANPEKFTSPRTTEIVEILVPYDTLAQRLKNDLLAGADPKLLARAHTTREGADHHDGLLTLNHYTQAYYQGIYDLAQGLEVDQIGGPVRIEGGFSVFKVVGRYQRKHPYDATARRRATAYVKIDKSKRGYVSYVRGLREKHPVEIFDDVVDRALTVSEMGASHSDAAPPN